MTKATTITYKASDVDGWEDINHLDTIDLDSFVFSLFTQLKEDGLLRKGDYLTDTDQDNVYHVKNDSKSKVLVLELDMDSDSEYIVHISISN
ncbi:PTS sucrose transporter subunit IIABC-like protein [Bacillus phage Shbh1]|uniref:PTS sucrose transporter subunit IIABC-like protein n=1 Tax=Bacillus phage Shbh1 TaxID=1796992 RepID=A0A142F173_9CAUD|nr:PTS sucrose transporter subunit IIABC-like protein [Bacillus phage Shbh1]AMQ66530.1 PTS sucrose transporter subunit IIABC-like protein [Bacillus phage Shbh1]